MVPPGISTRCPFPGHRSAATQSSPRWGGQLAAIGPTHAGDPTDNDGEDTQNRETDDELHSSTS
jgi:hypothetical protein